MACKDRRLHGNIRIIITASYSCRIDMTGESLEALLAGKTAKAIERIIIAAEVDRKSEIFIFA